MNHRRFAPSHEVAFWNGRIAATEEDATRAVLEIGYLDHRQRFEFAWPEQKSELGEIELALGKAFLLGKAEGKREVRAALGI